MKKTILLFVIFSVASFLPAPHAEEKPTYTVKRTTGSINVDGLMTEGDWQAAQSAGDFVFPWYEGGKKEQTDARLLWDDEYLYVVFRCEDEHISAHNITVYADDCVEVFVAPNPDQPLWYANFEVNVRGKWIFGKHKGESVGSHYPQNVLTAGTIVGTRNKEDDTDEYWIMEIAIPFEVYSLYETQLPPEPGDVWHINLNRIGGDVNPQFSQWTPSQTDYPQFHSPADFGQLVFSGEAVSVEDTETIVPYQFSLQQNYPNPFNPVTTIDCQLAIPGHVSIKVYNVVGQEIATLVNEFRKPGKYSVVWDAVGFPNGVYLYKIETSSFTETKKMLLLK